MTKEEAKNVITLNFSSENKLRNAIDLNSLIPLSLSSAQNNPQLNRFFHLDEKGPFSEINQRGVQSIRNGFYKIITQPYYRTNFLPGTFAADVYYLNLENENLIKYHANIGPLTNTSMQYYPFNDNISNESQIPILSQFKRDKMTYYTPENHYMTAKTNFYNSLYREQRIIYVMESGWDPNYPDTNKRKQVKWALIDF